MQQNSSRINLVATVLPCLEILNMCGPKIWSNFIKEDTTSWWVWVCASGCGYVQAGCGGGEWVGGVGGRCGWQ